MKKVICVTALVETSPQALPLGAACVCSAINAHPLTKDTYHAELFDFSLEDGLYTPEKAAAKILSGNPDVVAFSVYVWNRKFLEETGRIIKERNSAVVTLAGGPEVTADPSSFVDFDHTISGEGEIKVPVLLAGLSSDAGELPVSDLDTMSFSPYLDGTISLKKYCGALWELARGCPFKCSYCYESKGEKKVRYFPIERIKKELELFAREKIPQVFVLDPTYNASKKRALEMLALIKKITPDTFYYFEARAEFIDRELAKAFSEIPCALQFGLQSSNEEVLKKVNRTLNKKLFARNIGYLNEAGAIFGFDLIYGLPGDNLAGFKESIDFALSLYPNNLELFCLSVLPGTTLADDARRLGLVWQDKPPYHVIRSDGFSEKDLLAAEKISRVTNVFYNEGKAVPWFNAVIHPLKMKPSAFFSEISSRELPDSNDYAAIEEFQIEIIREKYTKKNLSSAFNAARDFIVLNNAMSQLTATGKESEVRLTYHPDDLMSGYASDIVFFAKNCRPMKNTTRVFSSKNGPDWKTVR